jgi:hypothetical protein
MAQLETRALKGEFVVMVAGEPVPPRSKAARGLAQESRGDGSAS